MRTSLISLCLAVLAVMAFAASPDDKPEPSDGDQASAANRRGWPETDEMVAGRLAIQDHGMQQRAHVLSVVVELKNRSGHALEMEFDPHDLRIEIFNSDGGRIEQKRCAPMCNIPAESGIFGFAYWTGESDGDAWCYEIKYNCIRCIPSGCGLLLTTMRNEDVDSHVIQRNR